jgi:hypothetical protein
MNIWQIARGCYPPWRYQNDGTVHHLFKPEKRLRWNKRKQRPGRSIIGIWALAVTVIMATVNLVDIVAPYTRLDYGFSPRFAQAWSIFPFVWMGFAQYWFRLRAFEEIPKRAAQLPTAKRPLNEWVLVRLTTIPRVQLLARQMSVLSWQVYPAQRLSIMLHSLVAFLGVSVALNLHALTLLENQELLAQCGAACKEPSHYPSTLMVMLPVIALGLLYALIPLIDLPFQTAAAMLGSTRSPIPGRYTYNWSYLAMRIMVGLGWLACVLLVQHLLPDSLSISRLLHLPEVGRLPPFTLMVCGSGLLIVMIGLYYEMVFIAMLAIVLAPITGLPYAMLMLSMVLAGVFFMLMLPLVFMRILVRSAGRRFDRRIDS